jgi:Iron-sulfur cluster-binding domain
MLPAAWFAQPRGRRNGETAAASAGLPSAGEMLSSAPTARAKSQGIEPRMTTATPITAPELRPDALSRLLAEAIDDLGYQPFVAVGLECDGWMHALLCPTQNEAAAFVEELHARGATERSAFLAGIAAALLQDGSGAIAALSIWLGGREESLSATIDLPDAATAGFAHCVGYPLIRLVEDGTDDAAGRPAAAGAMAAALAQAQGNDLLRWSLCEALALALARDAAGGGDPEPARRAVEAALGCLPQSPQLLEAWGGLNQTQPIGMEAAPEDGASAVLYRRLCELPHQPLFAVAIAEHGHEPATLTALDGSERARLVAAIRRAPAFDRCRFLRAYAAALEGETYDAGEDWFAWTADADDRFEAVVESVDPQTAAFPGANGYPLLYVVERDDGSGDGETRIAALTNLLDGYETRPGNALARNPLLEGLALALSKCLGARGRHGEALALVRRVLQQTPRSIHIKAAENALERRLAGEPVPERLQKFIGADNGALKPRICDLPFTRFDIGPDGNVLMCCGHWLPTSIGNIMTNSTEEVLNSPMAQKIRASMLDGTFKYCNHLECGAMVQDTLPYQSAVDQPVLRQAIDAGRLTLDGVRDLLFAFDPTCNLSCPSCRTHRIVEKPSENEAKADAVERSVLPLLPKLQTLFINPAGELLLSKPSRRLLELVSRETCPDLWLDIISNGTLFTEKEWEKFPNIHDMVRSIRISVDGCTQPTFESLRRLGNFAAFSKNMEFLGRLRAEGVLPELKFSFTYQLGNFREMRDFVYFARGFNCDFVIFERLQNLGTFTNEEYRARAVHLSDHELHAEFLAMIRDPVFRQPCVWHEFEWEGTVDHHTAEERQRWYSDSLKYAGSPFVEPATAD